MKERCSGGGAHPLAQLAEVRVAALADSDGEHEMGTSHQLTALDACGEAMLVTGD